MIIQSIFAFIGFLLTGFFLVHSVGAKPIDLWDVYRLSLNYEEDYAIAEQSVVAQKQSRERTRSALFPQINFVSSHTENRYKYDGSSQLGAFDLSQFGFSLDTSLFSPQKERTENYVFLSQSVFDYANISANNKAKHDLNTSKLQQQQSLQNTLLSLARNYFSILNTQVTLAASLANQKFVKKHLDTTKRRYKNHQATNADLLETEDDYQRLQLEIRNHRNTLSRQKLALASMIGKSLDDYEIKSVSTFDQFDRLDFKEDWHHWLDITRKNNLRAKISQNLVYSAKQSVNIAKSEYLPKVDFTMQHILDAEAGQVDYFANSPEAIYTLRLSMPIFQGFKSDASSKQARALLRQKELELSKAQKNIQQELRTSYDDFFFFRQNIKASKGVLSTSEKKLATIQKSFLLGDRTNADLLSAQYNHQAARTDYIKTIHRFLLSYLTLKQKIGILSSQDIKQLNLMFIK